MNKREKPFRGRRGDLSGPGPKAHQTLQWPEARREKKMPLDTLCRRREFAIRKSFNHSRKPGHVGSTSGRAWPCRAFKHDLSGPVRKGLRESWRRCRGGKGLPPGELDSSPSRAQRNIWEAVEIRPEGAGGRLLSGPQLDTAETIACAAYTQWIRRSPWQRA